MTRRHPDDPPPSWRPLSAELEPLMREDYARGLTARQLAWKYATSPSTVYRRAAAGGWTKRALGAARARALIARRDAKAAEAAAAPPATPLEKARARVRAVRRLTDEALEEGRVRDLRPLLFALGALEARYDRARDREVEARRAAAPAPEAVVEQRLVEQFGYTLDLAAAMLHNPEAAPAVLQGLVAEWRWRMLGEGDEHSVAAAWAGAEDAQQRFAMPGKLRARLDAYLARPRPDWRGPRPARAAPSGTAPR